MTYFVTMDTSLGQMALGAVMNMLSKVALSALVVVSASAQAAISYGASNAGQPYVGVSVGQITPTVGNIKDKSTAYGIYGGYNFDQNFGVQVEYTGSDTKPYTIGANRYEYNAKNYGAYGTYRYHFNNTPFYAKAKVGMGNTKINDKGITQTSQSLYSKTSLAGGVGVGYTPTNNFGVEAGYNYLNGDSKSVTVGAHLAF